MMSDAIILFDLDDTLYAERDFLHSGWHAVAAASGIDPSEAYALMRSADNAFDALHERVPGFSVAEMLDIYRNHVPEISLPRGVAEMLGRLSDIYGGAGIISDGRSATQRNKIKALGIESYFSYISISEEIGADKTSPVPFRLAMRHFGEDKSYIYVGDNIAKDFLWPNRLGWRTVMLEEPVVGRNIHSQQITPPSAEHYPLIRTGNIMNLVE
ncbi:MAG: HAD family hydrolase [Muribaculaceae bacterium]|nr:HAD family hydrolase [Muribaculaceae bacterium]